MKNINDDIFIYESLVLGPREVPFFSRMAITLSLPEDEIIETIDGRKFEYPYKLKELMIKVFGEIADEMFEVLEQTDELPEGSSVVLVDLENKLKKPPLPEFALLVYSVLGKQNSAVTAMVSKPIEQVALKHVDKANQLLSFMFGEGAPQFK